MKFTPLDYQRVQNLIFALKKAKFDDMVGVELLAFAQMFQWVNVLAENIKREVEQSQPKTDGNAALANVKTTNMQLPTPIQEPAQASRARKVVSIKDRKKTTKTGRSKKK